MSNKIIKAKGHEFMPFFSIKEIEYRIQNLVKHLNEDYPGGLVICPVLTGAFMFTVDLVQRLTVPVKLSFIKYRSYQGMKSTGKLNPDLPLNKDIIKDKDILILEDIVDTGYTVNELRRIALDLGAKSVKVCTLLFRPGAFKGQQKPEYIGYNLPDNVGFVIGYGMDLDERYRELPEIWAEQLS